MSEQRIEVLEGTAPLRRYRFSVLSPNNEREAYRLDDADALEFRVAASDEDSGDLFVYSIDSGNVSVLVDGADDGAKFSRIHVQFNEGDLSSPGRYRYAFLVTKGDTIDDLGSGPLIIKPRAG